MIAIVEESAGRVGFYDPVQGLPLAYVSVGALPHEIAISEDGATAYVSNFGVQDYDENIGKPGYSISVIDIPNACEIDRFFTFDEAGTLYSAPHGLKIRPNKSELYINVEHGSRILVFDIPQKNLKKVLTLPQLQPFSNEPFVSNFPTAPGTHNFVFSKDGNHIFLFAGKNGVFRMNADTGQIDGKYEESCIRGLVFMPDFSALIASGINEIVLLDPEDLSVIRRHGNLGVQQILYSDVTPDGKQIIAPAVWDSQVLVLNANDGRILKRVVTGLDPVCVKVSGDGNFSYVTNARSRFVSRIDLNNYEVKQIRTGEGPNGIAICSHQPYRTRKSLKFGAVLPLSGVDATSGRELFAGYEYWKELVNEGGGLVIAGDPYQVEIVYLDNQSNPDRTAEAVNQLLDREDVRFLFGGYPTASDLSAAKIAHDRRIPIITGAGTGAVIYSQGFEFVFGVMSPAGGYLKESIDLFLQQQPKFKTFSVLSCDDPAALEDGINTAKYAISLGLKILSPPLNAVPVSEIDKVEQGVIVYKHGSTDFLRLVRLIKGLGPDVFLQTGHLPEGVAVVRAAAETDFTPMALSFSVGPSLPGFLADLGPLALNLFGAAQWLPQIPTLGTDRFVSARNFADAYSARYNLEASYLSAGAFACGLTYEDAFRRSSTLDPNAIRNTLATTHLPTFYGLLEFDSRGINAKKPLVTFQIQPRRASLGRTVLWPVHLAGSNKPVWPFPGWRSPAGSSLDFPHSEEVKRRRL